MYFPFFSTFLALVPLIPLIVLVRRSISSSLRVSSAAIPENWSLLLIYAPTCPVCGSFLMKRHPPCLPSGQLSRTLALANVRLPFLRRIVYTCDELSPLQFC